MMKRLICLVLSMLMLAAAGAAAAASPDLRDVLIQGFRLNDDAHLDAFIAHYQLTAENLKEKNIPYLYQQFIASEAYRNPLMDELTGEVPEPGASVDLTHPASLLVVLNDDNQVGVTLYDFVNRAVYTGDGAFLHDPAAGEKHSLDAAREAKVLGILAAANLSATEGAENAAPANDSLQALSCSITVRDARGSIGRFTASGKVPAEWYDLMLVTDNR